LEVLDRREFKELKSSECEAFRYFRRMIAIANKGRPIHLKSVIKGTDLGKSCLPILDELLAGAELETGAKERLRIFFRRSFEHFRGEVRTTKLIYI
jgi:hypothetical protein